MNDIEGRLRDAGQALLAAAWPRLEEERVVPPPISHPYIEVGRDYFGDSVMALAEYQALEDVIAASHPRFDAGALLDEREFPGGLIYKKNHRYLTVVVDHDTGRLVWAAAGNDKPTPRRS